MKNTTEAVGRPTSALPKSRGQRFWCESRERQRNATVRTMRVLEVTVQYVQALLRVRSGLLQKMRVALTQRNTRGHGCSVCVCVCTCAAFFRPSHCRVVLRQS